MSSVLLAESKPSERNTAGQPPTPPRAEASHARPSWSSHFFNPRKEPPLNPLAYALRGYTRASTQHLCKCHILPLVHIDKQITPSCFDHSLSVPNPNRCLSRSSTLN